MFIPARHSSLCVPARRPSSLRGAAHLLLLAVGLGAATCTNRLPENAPPKNAPATLPPSDRKYWYEGKAEISTFDLEQRRYGQMRRAQQVNVFVTEDFSKQKQVKLDDPGAHEADRVPVLKLNALRRFNTGIYDYSVMMSVFSPAAPPFGRAVKATWSIQDWCGQVFAQANRQPDESYRFRLFSYFESEGDSDEILRTDWLEDEIWTALRLQPDRFGRIEKVNVLPSMLYFRFQHRPLRPYEASFSIEKGERESTLHLRYSDLPRRLSIRFETAWPHRILGWEEIDNEQVTSRATLVRILRNAYWQHNDNDGLPLRDSLGLSFFR